MVFQKSNPFPKSIFENVAFGLRVRRLAADEVRRRVAEALGRVQMTGWERHYPRQLSGGQQQRVALARALVIQPSVLLLDEPLSNLDARLRLTMREEIRSLVKSLGITTIFVTHDQEESLTMADRIVVMHRGLVEQIGTPDEIYERPATAFVARFVGVTNLFERVSLIGQEGERCVVRDTRDRQLFGRAAIPEISAARQLAYMIRPERLNLSRLDSSRRGQPVETVPGDANRLSGRVVSRTYAGSSIEYRVVDEGGFELLVDQPNRHAASFAAGDEVLVWWAPEDGLVLAHDPTDPSSPYGEPSA
jgi:ABC-type Fe3+/spermidine/putrescine transport system ATPase subunit